jgi:hypothetical protein
LVVLVRHNIEKIKKIKNKMSDLKLYLINGSTLVTTTVVPIQDWLKIILLLITIGYTIAKWTRIKKEIE